MTDSRPNVSSPVRAGAGVLLATIVTKVFDMAKNIVAVSRLGVTSQADVYNVVMGLPEFVVVVVGLDTVRGVATTFFTEDVTNGNREHLQRTFSSLVTWGLTASLFLGLLSIACMRSLIAALAPGFSDQRLLASVALGYVMIPALVMRGVVGLFQAALNAFGVFVRLSWLPGIVSVFVLVAVLVAPSENVARFATVAYAAGYMLYALVLVVMVRRRIPWRLRFGAVPPAFRSILRMSGALVLSMVIAQLAVLVEKRTASYFPEGTIAALGYASALASQFVFLGVLSLFAVVQRRLTEHVMRQDMATAGREFWELLSYVLFGIVFGAAVLVASGDTVLTVLYRRQAFDALALQRTAAPLALYAWWMVGQTVTLLTTTFLLAMKRSRAILISSIVAYGLEIALLPVFAAMWGPIGIAAGSLTATTVYGMCLLIGLHLAAGPSLRLASGAWRGLRIVAAGIVAGGAMAVLQTVHAATSVDALPRLIIVMCLGAVVYVGVSSLMRVNYIRPLVSAFRGRAS